MKTKYPSCKGIIKILGIVLLIVVSFILIKVNVLTKKDVHTDILTNKTEIVEEIKKPEEVKETKEPEVTETHEEIIARLVKDVNSGKAGNGDARKAYLGEYYSEVQKIINKQYAEIAKKEEAKRESSTSSNNSTKTTTVSGTKAEYQAYAKDLVLNTYGWSEADFEALVKLWNRESGWNANAHNKSSGAHGIPQSLPASKMASEGSDYYTNGYTQIRWGLKYIKNRYGSPLKAWQHSQNKGWY